MSKTEQLEILFSNWRIDQGKESNDSPTMLKGAKIVEPHFFCADGIVCEEEFEKQDTKVLFIANEPNTEHQSNIVNKKKPNAESSQIDEFIKYYESHEDEWSGKLRKRICEIIYPAMLEPHKNVFPVENGWENAKKIAFMNLNKRGGKGNIEKHLQYYCKKYVKKIIDEIYIIKPDIIVWLGKGSFDMCRNILFGEGCKQIDSSCFLVKIKDYTIPLIQTHHTSSRISNQKRGNIVRAAYENYKRNIGK